MTEYKVISVYAGEKMYQVGRIIDPSQRMHSGNVEYVGGLFDNKADAQALAEKLNGKAMVEKLADKYYYKELSHD